MRNRVSVPHRQDEEDKDDKANETPANPDPLRAAKNFPVFRTPQA